MTEFQLDKRHYHLQTEIYNWCEEKFGHGCWASPTKNQFPEWVKTDWTMDSVFGNTFVYFKNPTDATLFALRWVNGS